MRSFAILGFVAAAAALRVSPDGEYVAPEKAPDYAPEVTLLEANKSFVVKLQCQGCPLAKRKSAHDLGWVEGKDNALLLKVGLDESESTLSLNGHRILPLGSMPLDISAIQVPLNTTKNTMEQYIGMDFKPVWPWKWGLSFPLQFQHTLLRTEEGNKLWVQFDVTGLPYADTLSPVKMDKDNQKIVQILVRQHSDRKISIEDLQVVLRKDRAKPYKMKCGNLAMVQTAFDPNEWDEFGKLGTLTRTGNVILSKVFDFQSSPLLLPVALVLAFSVFLARGRFAQRRQAMNDEEEVEYSLLEYEYLDLPPEYANIPVIKIEEYE